MSSQDPTALWPLKGRDCELSAMEAAWSRKDLVGIAICGPAGVGKSRLAEECLARVAVRG